MSTNDTNIREIRDGISENSRSIHKSVLLKEVITYLSPQPNENFIDCTIGGGGQALAILNKTKPNGRLLGIDWSKEAIEKLNFKFSAKGGQISNFKSRVILVNDNFVNLKKIVEKYNFSPVNGILIDLGLSSDLLEKSGRGFSFLKNEFLDMRYSSAEEITAYEIVNQWSEKEIEKILKDYGEERFAKIIATEIIKKRKTGPIKTTFDLVEIIKRIVPIWYQKKRIHPATKTFQALRIAVNDELENLKKVLPQILEILRSNGRVAIISYHSLEDRIVKNFFQEKKKEGTLKILTKKPIRPTEEEIKNNPRCRSAKLRVAQKL